MFEETSDNLIIKAKVFKSFDYKQGTNNWPKSMKNHWYGPTPEVVLL